MRSVLFHKYLVRRYLSNARWTNDWDDNFILALNDVHLFCFITQQVLSNLR